MKLSEDANKNRDKGIGLMKTCPLLFKCKPNFEDAIPYFKSAANGYKSVKNHKDEIFCRMQLASCFQKTNSLWEEGNEYERIANIQYLDLNDEALGFRSITNAHQAYYTAGDYQSCVNASYKLANLLRQEEKLESSEKVLKIAFDSMLKFGHLVVSKDDIPSDYIYKSFKLYFALLLQNHKTRIAIESSELLFKSLQSFEKDLSEIFIVYFHKLLGLAINEEELTTELIDECKNISDDKADHDRLKALVELNKAIKSSDIKKFDDNTYEIGVGLDNEVIKKLKVIFNNNKKQKEDPKQKNIVDNEGGNDEDYL